MFARPDRPQTLQSIFENILWIACWSSQCPAGFLVHEELVSEVFTSCLFTLKAILPWCAVQQNSSQYLEKIAEFTNEQITDKPQDWRLRRAKSTLFEAIINVAQTPSQVPDSIRNQAMNESKIIEILKSAIISYNTNHSSSDFQQNLSTTGQNNKFLPERVKIRAMNTLLIQPWKSQDNLSWHEKAELHGKFISVVLKPLLDNSNNSNEEKYICLVMCRDMIKSSSNFTNSKPRTIIAKSVEGVLNSVSSILPESLKQENMDIQQTMLNQECMAIAMTVLESIRIQVGVTWCSSFVDMMMETVTKSKVAFIQSMTGADASLTVLGRFIVVLQTCLTCESSSFKKKFEAVPILQFVVGALWKQLCKYCDKNDNGSGIKGMLIKFLTNVLGYRWRTFFPELVGKWKTIDEATSNVGGDGDTNNNFRQQAAMAAANNNSQTTTERIAHPELLSEILAIFGQCMTEAAATENLEMFTTVIESMSELQLKHKLFEKRIFKESISDFVWLMIKSWQSGVANRVQDELANLLFSMVNVKGMMGVFVERILPEYLNSHSGVNEDGYKKVLHDMVLSEDGGSVAMSQTVFDLSIESTFKFRMTKFINDARFYTSLQS